MIRGYSRWYYKYYIFKLRGKIQDQMTRIKNKYLFNLQKFFLLLFFKVLKQ